MPTDAPVVLDLPLSMELLTTSRETLRHLFRKRRRGSGRSDINGQLLFRTAVYHLARRVEAGLEPAPRRNVRGLWYTLGRPLLVTSGAEFSDPFNLFVSSLTSLVREHGLLDYATLDVTDENWENRRIGARHPGVILFSEQAGQIRLLREVHATLGVSIQALRGNPSAVTSSYVARHTRETLGATGPIELVGLVDFDPFGYQIARSFLKHLEGFGLTDLELTLVLHPAMFTDAERAMHAVPVSTGPPHAGLGERWLAATGGVDGQLLGLSAGSLGWERTLAATLRATEAAIRRPR